MRRPTLRLSESLVMLFSRSTDCPISINPTIIVSLLPTSLLHYPLLSHSHYASRGAVCVRRSPFATSCADWIRGWIQAESIIRDTSFRETRQTREISSLRGEGCFLVRCPLQKLLSEICPYVSLLRSLLFPEDSRRRGGGSGALHLFNATCSAM